MMHESALKFIKIIGKIPMFQGLMPAQALEVLKSVEPKVFMPKQVVCEAGSKSNEMYILLAGQLAVRSRDGMPLATIDPIVTVGEMGLITGHLRSATVVAVKQSNALMLTKMKFDVLLRKVPDVGLIVYRNIIITLTDRISENNKQVASYQRQLESLKLQFGEAEAPAVSEQEAGSSEQEAAPSGQEALSTEKGSASLLGEDAEEQPHQAKT